MIAAISVGTILLASFVGFGRATGTADARGSVPVAHAEPGPVAGAVVFWWSNTGGTSYDVAFYGTGFSSTVLRSNLTQLSLQVTGVPGGTYHVKVRADYGSRSSSWSSWAVTTLPALSPVNSTNTTTTLAPAPATTTVAPVSTIAPTTAAPTTAAPTTLAPTTTVAPSTTASPATTTPPAAPGYTVTLNPALGTSGWSLETSGSQESIVNMGDRLECTAGGYTATTHYARAKRKLPETDDLVVTGSWTMTVTFDLPADFYSRNESYFRFMNTDNYPGKMKSTGATVGAASADEWRVGFLIYNSDKLPRLQSDHQNHEKLTLWTGSQPLPVGRTTVTVHFTPSQGTDGSFQVWINGVLVGQGQGLKTVPSTLAPSEAVVTRVVGGIDGAAQQSTQPMSVSLRTLSFSVG